MVELQINKPRNDHGGREPESKHTTSARNQRPGSDLFFMRTEEAIASYQRLSRQLGTFHSKVYKIGSGSLQNATLNKEADGSVSIDFYKEDYGSYHYVFTKKGDVSLNRRRLGETNTRNEVAPTAGDIRQTLKYCSPKNELLLTTEDVRKLREVAKGKTISFSSDGGFKWTLRQQGEQVTVESKIPWNTYRFTLDKNGAVVSSEERQYAPNRDYHLRGPERLLKNSFPMSRSNIKETIDIFFQSYNERKKR